MHTTWANDPVNSPNHYTRSHPGMECIELTADTSFCLGNAIKYLWRYHSKGRPVEDLEKARWYLCRVIDYDEKIAWTRQQHAILDTLANDPAIPDAEAHTWAKLRQGFPYSAPRLPRPPHRTRKEPTMSTRIYCDQCGTETSKRKALRFSLSGYSANRTSMGQLNDIEIDICPDCAQRFNDQTIGTIHIRRDHRDKLSPYLLEYQSTDLKEDQA